MRCWLLEILLILTPGQFQEERFYLVATLVLIPMLGFLVAFALRGDYGGALYDPDGIQPLRFPVRNFASTSTWQQSTRLDRTSGNRCTLQNRKEKDHRAESRSRKPGSAI